jgi:hypothetical protein
VLVLHGGASRGDRMMVSPTQLSVVRIVPTAKAAARAGNGRLAVYRLLNTWRGWDGDHTRLDGKGREFDRRAAVFTAETLLSRV